MDHIYDYYKKLPRDHVVGGFVEITGGADIDFDDVSIEDDDRVRAEIYGAHGAESASTVDDGILKLFARVRDDYVNPRHSRDKSEDPVVVPAGKKKKANARAVKKRRGAAEDFSLAGDAGSDSEPAAESFSLADVVNGEVSDASDETSGATKITPEEFAFT